jgi:hypothetical protein
MSENEDNDESKFIVDYQLADGLWNMFSRSPHINFGPDPPILLVAEATYSLYKDNRKMHKWRFTRFPGEEYESDDHWMDIPNTFNMDGREAYIAHFFKDPDHFDIGNIQITSQIYSNSGGMITFDIKQHLGEDPSAFIRVPVDMSLSGESEEGPWPGDFEKVHYQVREFSGKYGSPPEGTIDYYHPHYKSNGGATRGEIVQMFEKLLDMVERSECMWRR